MKITKSELQKLIQEAINEALMSESNKKDDIDADRDDKVEDAKAELDKKIDDIDSDKDEKRVDAEKDFEKKEDDADADKDEKEKNESLNESSDRILTAEEFLDWHDNKSNYQEDRRLFDAIYEIFKRNGFTEDDDVDVCYDGLPKEDKIKVTDIIKSKYTLDEDLNDNSIVIPKPWDKYYVLAEDQDITDGDDMACNNGYDECKHIAFVQLKDEYFDKGFEDYEFGELVDCDGKVMLAFLYGYGSGDTRCILYSFDEVDDAISDNLSEGKKSKKKSVGQELKDDQEWVDYDMKHDHHISKATQKDIEDQGLQIEKDQYGDYEVTAGHYDESLNESYEDTAEDLKLEVQRLLPDDYAVVVVPGDYIRTDDKDHENEFTGEILPQESYDYNPNAEASVNIVPNHLYSEIMDNFDYDGINDEIGSFKEAFAHGWVEGDPDCFIAYINLKHPQFICYDAFNSNTYKDVYLDYKDFKDFARDIVDRFNK